VCVSVRIECVCAWRVCTIVFKHHWAPVYVCARVLVCALGVCVRGVCALLFLSIIGHLCALSVCTCVRVNWANKAHLLYKHHTSHT